MACANVGVALRHSHAFARVLLYSWHPLARSPRVSPVGASIRRGRQVQVDAGRPKRDVLETLQKAGRYADELPLQDQILAAGECALICEQIGAMRKFALWLRRMAYVYKSMCAPLRVRRAGLRAAYCAAHHTLRVPVGAFVGSRLCAPCFPLYQVRMGHCVPLHNAERKVRALTLVDSPAYLSSGKTDCG